MWFGYVLRLTETLISSNVTLKGGLHGRPARHWLNNLRYFLFSLYVILQNVNLFSYIYIDITLCAHYVTLNCVLYSPLIALL